MKLALETISTCNRVCPTCLRNSYPDREKVASWFEPSLLPMGIINKAFEQYAALPKTDSTVCLSHYNEPLMDARIPVIARVAKSYGFARIYLNTNGDFLTDEIAKSLDGVLDRIRISFRKGKFDSLFQKTEVVYTEYGHIATHFSPEFDVEKLSGQYRNNPCFEPARRIIINHEQRFLLCCEDIVGEFDLGTFPGTSIEEFLERRTPIIDDLSTPGGRNKHKYCFICPRA
ncbi:MAG: hypothetical protein IMY80_02870 [Chloroflexi bacterium]|nr:hypothetical protein [Chloroflexota bacterium]